MKRIIKSLKDAKRMFYFTDGKHYYLATDCFIFRTTDVNRYLSIKEKVASYKKHAPMYEMKNFPTLWPKDMNAIYTGYITPIIVNGLDMLELRDEQDRVVRIDKRFTSDRGRFYITEGTWNKPVYQILGELYDPEYEIFIMPIRYTKQDAESN